MIGVNTFTKISENLAYCLNIDDVNSCLTKYELKTRTKFSVSEEDEGFGKIGKSVRRLILVEIIPNQTR